MRPTYAAAQAQAATTAHSRPVVTRRVPYHHAFPPANDGVSSEGGSAGCNGDAGVTVGLGSAGALFVVDVGAKYAVGTSAGPSGVSPDVLSEHLYL